MADNDAIILIILCIFLPPLAIYWKSKQCDIFVIVCLVLCLLFWLPGIIMAFWYCFMRQ